MRYFVGGVRGRGLSATVSLLQQEGLLLRIGIPFARHSLLVLPRLDRKHCKMADHLTTINDIIQEDQTMMRRAIDKLMMSIHWLHCRQRQANE